MVVDACRDEHFEACAMLQKLGATVHSASSSDDFDPKLAADLCVILFFFEPDRPSAWRALTALSLENTHLLNHCVVVTKASFITTDPRKVPVTQILFEPVAMEALLTCIEGVAFLSDSVSPCPDQPVIAA